jgi:hypothetical protein
VETGVLTVTLSGDSFARDTTLASISSNNEGHFIIRPKTGLSAGTYSATVTVTSVYGISQSFDVNFQVNKITPDVSYLNYTLPAASAYDGNPHGITTPTLKTEYTGLGTVTVAYNAASAAPINAGTYTVTANIAANSTNFNAGTVSLGTITISKVTPTKAHLNAVNVKDSTYNGTPQRITPLTLKSPLTGLGAVTKVYYSIPVGSGVLTDTVPPTDAGKYAVKVNIAAGTNFNAVTELALDTFVIRKAPVKKEYLEYSLTPIDTGNGVWSIKTPTLKAPYTGLGAVKVMFGDTTCIDGSGVHPVKVNITEGTNFIDTTGLSLGSLTAIALTVPTVQGAEILPAAGFRYVASGDSIKFVIRPSGSGTFSSPPTVTTGRTDDATGGVTVQSNGDKSYTVVVRNILTLFSIQINTSTVGEEIVIIPVGVWSSGRELHIVASVAGQATVYTLTGTRVKTIPLAAGETVVDATLPPGIYLVALEGQNSKVIIR